MKKSQDASEFSFTRRDTTQNSSMLNPIPKPQAEGPVVHATELATD